MPTYAYKCETCHDTTEIVTSIGTARRVRGCECGGIARLRIGVGVNVAPSALENKGAPVRDINTREGRWDRDMPAYYRMRRKGMQPNGIDGCAVLENEVGDQFDVKYKRVIDSVIADGSTREQARARIQGGEEHAKEIMEESGSTWPGTPV